MDAVRRAYDQVAVDYAAAFGDDLAQLPLDRQVLDRALTLADPAGWVLEAGCGPAPALAYFGDRVDRGVGVDLSRQMLATAVTASLRPVAQADLRALPMRGESCGLVIVFYVLQHVRAFETVLAECARVTRPGGALAVATHLGDGEVVLEEFLGHRIEPMAGALHDRDDVVERLARSGYAVLEEHQRDPLPHEYPSRRLYLLSQRT